ncbi:MAG: pyridoxal-phosphate dependent enzyme [Candidatus Dormibacteria bacterium]
MLDLTTVPFTVDDIEPDSAGIWRYATFFPPVPEPGRLRLGEQVTPLLERPDLGVHLKLDHLLPSGSYKDRGACLLVSRLAHLGVHDVVLDSSGNAGAAISAYCAAASIGCRVFVPAGNSPGKLAQIAAAGAEVVPVPGLRRDATNAARAAAAGTLYASHNWHPDFLAGLASMGWEMWEQLGRRAPSAVVTPCGNGGIVLGLSRAFQALVEGGLLAAVPRIVAVQSQAFDAVARAMTDELPAPRARSHGQTIAEGIACELPVRGRQLLAALRRSGGVAIAVTDSQIRDAVLGLASSGIYVEPTAAVGLAGVAELRARGSGAVLGADPVVVLTGSGLKSGRAVADLRNPGWWPSAGPVIGAGRRSRAPAWSRAPRWRSDRSPSAGR